MYVCICARCEHICTTRPVGLIDAIIILIQFLAVRSIVFFFAIGLRVLFVSGLTTRFTLVILECDVGKKYLHIITIKKTYI